jgi:hypothetical protein
MPSVAPKTYSFEDLSSHFPLVYPIPHPKTHPDLITLKDLNREEDLLRNPDSFRAWWSAIQSTKDSFTAQLKVEKPQDLPEEVQELLGPLASPLARRYLQRTTYLYESALQTFPTSFKLWKAYLEFRMSFVLGKPIIKKRAGGKKKFPEMKDALEEEQDDLEEYDAWLDPVVGWNEWKALIATFERCLMWLPNVSWSYTALGKLLIQFMFLASKNMVNVSLDFHPSKMPTRRIHHTCPTYLRPSPSNAPPFPSFPHLGAVPSMGRTQRRRDYGFDLSPLPCNRPQSFREVQRTPSIRIRR